MMVKALLAKIKQAPETVPHAKLCSGNAGHALLAIFTAGLVASKMHSGIMLLSV